MTHASDHGRRGRRARRGLAILGSSLAVVTVAACSSGGGTSPTKATLPPTIPTTAPPTTTPLSGHLTMTGAENLSIPVATGQCRQPAGGLPKAFVVVDPRLGSDGYVAVYGPTVIEGGATVPANVKVYTNGVGLLSANSGTGVSVAPDLQSVTFDTDLGGGTGNAQNGSLLPTKFLRGHITGTLRCS